MATQTFFQFARTRADGNTPLTEYLDRWGKPAEIRRLGSASSRNNNPGNLQATEAEALALGGIGVDYLSAGASPPRGYVIFPDNKSGENALKKVLLHEYGDESITDMAYKSFQRIARPGMTGVVLVGKLKEAGLDLDNTKIKQLTPAELDQLVIALSKSLGYEQGIALDAKTREHNLHPDIPEYLLSIEDKWDRDRARRDHESGKVRSEGEQKILDYYGAKVINRDGTELDTKPFNNVLPEKEWRGLGYSVPPNTQGLDLPISDGKGGQIRVKVYHLAQLNLQGEQLISAQIDASNYFRSAVYAETVIREEAPSFKRSDRPQETDHGR